MKYISNIIIKKPFVYRACLGMFVTIVTLLLVACDAGGGTTTTTNSKIAITGTFSYADINASSGVEKTSELSWDVNPTDTGQTIEFSIALADGSPVASEITIDTSTGAITVSSNAALSSTLSYKVTATGTGNYTGTIETIVNIQVVQKGVDGAFSYSDIITPVGTGVPSTLITWDVNPTDIGQTIEFSITLADGSPVASEITIDTSTGAITVSNTAVKSSFDSLYKVTATGTGDYEGTIEAEMNIWVKASVYTPLNITSVTDFSHNHSPSNLPTSSFALKETTNGLTVNSISGIATVNSLRLRTGTYVIVITEGSLEYAVDLDVTVQLQPTTKSQLSTIVGAAIVDGGNTVNLNFIDTSLVTDMNSMFFFNNKFNGDVSEWETGNVTDMSNMFANANAFNGDISGWETGNVTDMSGMFVQAWKFNQDISGWTVSKVTTMETMFGGATAFNQNISGWTVSNVTNMSDMFSGASKFNQNISGWTVSNVTTMKNMFNGASVFNQNISGWTVSKVVNMQYMFANATAFNQNIDAWNVAGSVSKTQMFAGSGLVGNEPTWYTNPPAP